MGKRNDNFDDANSAARRPPRALELPWLGDAQLAKSKIQETVARRNASIADSDMPVTFRVNHFRQSDGTVLSALSHPTNIHYVGAMHWDPQQGDIHGLVVAEKYRHGLAHLIAAGWRHSAETGIYNIGPYNPGLTAEGQTNTTEQASRVLRNAGPAGMKPSVPAKGESKRDNSLGGSGGPGGGTADVMRFVYRFNHDNQV
jgi:hypothetical protein